MRGQPLSANVRHSLSLCFQPQDEIIQRHQLFHGASDNFFAQALKDTLPYFLGAVDEEYVRKREELKRLREQMRVYERQMNELKAISGNGISKAAILLAQTRDVGMSSNITNTWEETISTLRDIMKASIASSGYEQFEGQEYLRLANEREKLLREQNRLRTEIAAARNFKKDENGYSHEATEQYSRLLSIGIFDGFEPVHTCPLCAQEYPDQNVIPTILQMKDILNDVSSRLSNNTFQLISLQQRNKISCYLAKQIIRTMEHRKQIIELERKRNDILLNIWAEHSGERKELYRIKSPEGIEAKIHAQLIFSEKLNIGLSGALHNHIWIIGLNQTTLSFYTSDNPIAKRPHYNDPFFSMSGYNSKGIEIVYPLSPNLILCMYEKSCFAEYSKNDGMTLNLTDERNIIYYNAFQVYSSNRFIYSVKDNFEFAKQVCDRDPHYRNPDRDRVIMSNIRKPK